MGRLAFDLGRMQQPAKFSCCSATLHLSHICGPGAISNRGRNSAWQPPHFVLRDIAAGGIFSIWRHGAIASVSTATCFLAQPMLAWVFLVSLRKRQLATALRKGYLNSLGAAAAGSKSVGFRRHLHRFALSSWKLGVAGFILLLSPASYKRSFR